jgi:pyridoxine 5-phosphate synthase
VGAATEQFTRAGIRTSLFIDPDIQQLDAARELGAPVVELHTGTYADAKGDVQQDQLERLRLACLHGHALGLQINAGHGLHRHNVQAIVSLPHMHELNIGHSIVARSIFIGLEQAVSEMKQLIIESDVNS